MQLTKKKKKKSEHYLFQAQSFLINSVWKQGGCHFACLHCYKKCSPVLPSSLYSLSGTKALSFGAMQAALCDKVWSSSLLIINSAIGSAPLCCSIPFWNAILSCLSPFTTMKFEFTTFTNIFLCGMQSVKVLLVLTTHLCVCIWVMGYWKT